MKKYLVLVKFRKSVILPDEKYRDIEYYEVFADDDLQAKRVAFDEFSVEYVYKPWIKKYTSQFGNFSTASFTVEDCIEI